MKRWLAWILVFVCLLSGCDNQPEEPVNTTVATQPKSTEPIHTLYWKGSALEESSAGAVKIYGTDDSDITGIGFLDGDPVVLTARDGGTAITRIDGMTGEVKAEKLCGLSLSDGSGKGDCNVVMSGNRMAYYDAQENAIRLLDASLKELSKVKLQQVPSWTPLITGDLSAAYYCVDSEIRSLDLQTGIARMVCQRANQDIFPLALLLEDTVLSCLITDAQGKSYAEFLNTENGLSLATDENLLTVDSQGNNWLVTRLDGTTKEVLIGDRENVFGFCSDASGNSKLQLLPNGILQLEASGGDALIRLYDLETGKCLKQLKLTGVEQVYGALEDASGRYIWFSLRDQQTQQDVLCCWDTEVTEGSDETTRIINRYTAKNPDTAGLEALRQKAQQIGEKYGVQIHLYDDIPDADGFTITREYQVEAFNKALDELDRVMAKFPEGFFVTAAKLTNDKVFHIGFIRSVKPNSIGGNPQSDGLQYWINGSAWITLCVGEGIEQSFYHNLSHALDTYVYSNSIHYDFWSDPNPKGFQYDESYLYIDSHGDSPYLQGPNRAFVDAFSMTFPHEDRATFFAYAMMDGAAEIFESSYMQAKLKQLCIGIRQAFEWEKYDGILPWEQYLQESLAYQK